MHTPTPWTIGNSCDGFLTITDGSKTICTKGVAMSRMHVAERQKWIEKARAQYQNEGTIEIDDNAEVSRGDDGAYIHAWVWVPNEEEPS